MNRIFKWRAGLVSHRALAIVVCIGAFGLESVRLLAYFGLESPTKGSRRALTFEDRVRYQRAIEEVYWRHRIWPKESRAPRPVVETAISRTQLEKKVADYLRDSQALNDYWQAPLTAGELQTEMDRMARQSKQPEVLHELFRALGDDPLVIAECLARPVLAQRMLSSRYAQDDRIHGSRKKQAEADLQVHSGVAEMKSTSGTYTETTFVRSNNPPDRPIDASTHGIQLNDDEWNETIHSLATTFNRPNGNATTVADRTSMGVQPMVGARHGESSAQSVPHWQAAKGTTERLPVGQLSSLQEEETRYYATAIIAKHNDYVKVATVSWPKQSLESWRAKTQRQAASVQLSAVPNAGYTLPAISGKCSDGKAWADTALNAPIARERAGAVWTGTEFIIWGGYGGQSLNTGGRYNPITDTWTTTSTINAPSARTFHSAIWTGTELVVWGGGYYDGSGIAPVATGGRYNPVTDTWVPTSLVNAPNARAVHSTVWTGNEMIVWGGGAGDFGDFVNTGGRYNPTTDTWLTTSTTNAPIARGWHSAVWTGTEMMVWGGWDFFNSFYHNTGGLYNPLTNTWRTVSATNAPTGRSGHAMIWTGNEVILWGGHDNSNGFNTGARYNPSTDSWTPTSTTNVPIGGDAAYYAVWTGVEMMIWNGGAGGRYNPTSDAWTTMTAINAPSGRGLHAAIWTGTELIIWGGVEIEWWVSTMGRYNPATDTWDYSYTPQRRTNHRTVWTGTEMIIFGGDVRYQGGRYNPTTDSWLPVSSTGAPVLWYLFSAVWSGTEMIIWGGFDGTFGVNTGARYNPDTDAWTPTTTFNAPTGRSGHTAVWTGNEMIVWGGSDADGNLFNTGGRYNPSTDTWTATNITGAPAGRGGHTAVWTGSEMIVWGGTSDNYNNTGLNTGARYNPNTDSWIATSLTNAPSPRLYHAAVWTGSEMIIWGGAPGFPYPGTDDSVATGGRYDPAADAWKPTSVVNAPSNRIIPSAIWTGSEMIIWGGSVNHDPYWLGTGGRYDSSTDTWRAISTTGNAPIGRYGHSAVWNGDEMIIWGGSSLFFFVNTGGRYCPQSDPTTTPIPSPTPIPTQTYTISLVSSPTGAGTLHGAGIYDAGLGVTVRAEDNPGYNFANWTENGSIVSTSTTMNFTASADRTLTANFLTYPMISWSVSPAKIGKGGSATFTVTVTNRNPSQPLAVNYSIGGTAVLNTDYTLSGPTNYVVIPAGQSAGTVTLTAKTGTSQVRSKGKKPKTVTIGYSTGIGYNPSPKPKRGKKDPNYATVTINGR